MPLDYSRFDSLGDDSSDEGESEKARHEERGAGSQTLRGTEEGLVREFAEINRRRREADRLRSAGDLRAATALYDDACNRLLALAEVSREVDLEVVGHRIEVACARLGAARALAKLQDWPAAEARATGALDAAQLDAAAERRLSELGLLQRFAPSASGDLRPSEKDMAEEGLRLLHRSGAEAYALRSRARLQRGLHRKAQEDAWAGRSAARQRGDTALAAECEELAIEAHMLLEGVSPDGACAAGSPTEGLEVAATSGAGRISSSANAKLVGMRDLTPAELSDEENDREPGSAPGAQQRSAESSQVAVALNELD
eukprot:TRINITY_DN881_c0_g1_i2.p1 TRINITY_DN881_c0_g1~~TRINITY_DN881_c0_g1_i2.p1  ORF type:complete len:314 (-),score=76.77 TRINITY_DN881_c0_g1_i2:352-1293(-)